MLTDYCTIVSDVARLSQMLAAVRAAALKLASTSRAAPDDWQIVRLTSPGASLKLTMMQPDKPLAAARAVSGMIFNGHDLLTSDGAVLLASGK